MRYRKLGLLLAFVTVALTVGVALAGASGGALPPPNEFAPNQEVNRPTPNIDPPGFAAPRAIPGHTGQIKNGTPGLSGSFAGVNLIDTRSADNGNAYTVEPPDQGLCTNGSLVLEPVNDAFGIYDTSGNMVGGPVSLNSFFTGDVAITRTNGGPPYGKFLSDPKCYWDPDNHHWYFTVLEIDTNPATGAFLGHNWTLIFVSKGTTPSTDPNDWYHYSIDGTNDGGTAQDSDPTRTMPSHSNCPCYGDQPLIGADQYGFYVSTNEFPIFAAGFNGAQIYALDKNALASGTFKMQYVLESNFTGTGWSPSLEGGYIYSVQPATSPTAGSWSTSNDGTEYFLSALDFEGTLDNRIAAWAMTNTSSLASATPDVQLKPYSIVDSEVYGQPPPADQKSGPTPLGDYLGSVVQGFPYPAPTIETNDDRMNQVVYADGHLWSGVNTVMRTDDGASSQTTRAGIAWFIVHPSWTGSTFDASMANQGYVSAKNTDNAMFPSIGVNADGKGVMTFSVTGHHYYPSAAYAPIDLSGVGPAHIAGAGGMPADGFTGYPPYGGPPERWGDYSAAVGLPDGSVWAATEWIPGTFSFTTGGWFANWGTYVMHVTP
jgi:hypothetical protein